MDREVRARKSSLFFGQLTLMTGAVIFCNIMTPIELKTRLELHFPQGQVEVFDLTGGGDHYEVKVQAKEFQGQTRIQQHKMVMAAVQSELQSGEVHALSIKTEVP